MKAKRAPKLAPLPRGQGTLRWNAKREIVELRHLLDGKRYTERDATRAGCITKRDQRRARAQLVTLGDGSVKAWAEQWHAHKHGSSQLSQAKIEANAVAHIVDQLGNRLIVEVTVSDIEAAYKAWIEGRTHTGRKLGARSLKLNRRVLGTIFEFAHKRDGVITTAPFDHAEVPAGAAARGRADWLDADEARRMYEVLVDSRSTIATMCLVMLTTGLRPSEAAGLGWDDVDLDAGVLHVRAATHRLNNARIVERWHVDTHGVKALKTRQSQRSLGLEPTVVTALRRVHADQAEHKLAATSWANEFDLVFTDETGALIRHDGAIRKAVPRYCRRAHTKAISPNEFRHTFASMLLHVERRPITEVARAMGHKDTRQVIETYGHPMVEVVSTAGVYTVAS